jgi:hypothetical protein
MSDLRPIEKTADWGVARPGDVLAVFDHHEDLRTALRRRKEQIGMSFLELDERVGLPQGYTSKLLAPAALKNLGPLSLGLLLQGLGVRLALIADIAPTPLTPKREGGHMKLIVTIEAPKRAKAEGFREQNARNLEFSSALKLAADKIANCGMSDDPFEYGDLRGQFKIMHTRVQR